MSEKRDKWRREFVERLRYVLGEERWLKFVEMRDDGELEKYHRQFFEMLQSDEAEHYLKRFEPNKNFRSYLN